MEKQSLLFSSSNEEQFILELSKLELSEINKNNVNGLFSKSLNWNLIKEKAQIHQIKPLIYHNLKRLKIIEQHINYNISPIIIEFFEQSYKTNLARNIILFHESRKILEVFQNQGVPVILIKGILFAEMLYKKLALRVMSDIDLVVKPADFRRAASYLFQLGYSCRNPSEDVLPKSYTHQRNFVKQNIIPVSIDLHKQLLFSDRFRINEVKIWQRAIPRRYNGMNFLRLSNEDLILYSCLHNASHKFQLPWRFWIDIAEFIKEYSLQINWNYIIENAIQQKTKTPVYFSLYFLQKLLNIEIPSFVQKALEPNPIKKKTILIFLHRNASSMVLFFLFDRTSHSFIYSAKYIFRKIEPIFLYVLNWFSRLVFKDCR